MSNGERLQQPIEEPIREEIIATFLETALLVPQSTDSPSGIRKEGPGWLRNAYRHTFRDDICKELAALLVPDTDIEPYRLGMGPLLTEGAREVLVKELVDASPIPENSEAQIEEIIRLSGIHMLRKPNILTIMREQERQEVLRKSLSALADEELSQHIIAERRRVASDALRPVTRGLAF